MKMTFGQTAAGKMVEPQLYITGHKHTLISLEFTWKYSISYTMASLVRRAHYIMHLSMSSPTTPHRGEGGGRVGI